MSHELLYEINFDYFLLYFFSIVKERYYLNYFAFALKEQISIALAPLTFVISDLSISTFLRFGRAGWARTNDPRVINTVL